MTVPDHAPLLVKWADEMAQALQTAGSYAEILDNRNVEYAGHLDKALERLRRVLDEMREFKRAPHEVITRKCSRCNQKRTITVRIEHEVGEYGSILSSWPEFDVTPECPGLVRVDHERDHFVTEDFRPPTQEELDETKEADRPFDFGANCPFGLYFDGQPQEDWDAVMDEWRGRVRVLDAFTGRRRQ